VARAEQNAPAVRPGVAVELRAKAGAIVAAQPPSPRLLLSQERSDVVAYICRLRGDDRMIATTILNARDNQGNTALHLAVQRANQPALFRLLLTRKEVDLNIANRNGHTPLDLVFLSGKVDPAITGTEGYVIPHLAFLSGQRTFRYMQVPTTYVSFLLLS